MKNLSIAIGSDHAGYDLKVSVIEFLQSTSCLYKDFGTNSSHVSVDYPNIAFEVAENVASSIYDRGILICGSGLGVAIAANKVKKIRAVTCSEPLSARLSRLHNDANILTMGGRIIGPAMAIEIVKVWLDTSFEEDRHKKRVELIESYE